MAHCRNWGTHFVDANQGGGESRTETPTKPIWTRRRARRLCRRVTLQHLSRNTFKAYSARSRSPARARTPGTAAATRSPQIPDVLEQSARCLAHALYRHERSSRTRYAAPPTRARSQRRASSRRWSWPRCRRGSGRVWTTRTRRRRRRGSWCRRAC